MNLKISSKNFHIHTHTQTHTHIHTHTHTHTHTRTHAQIECELWFRGFAEIHKTKLKTKTACLSESINIPAESFATHTFFMKTSFKLQ